jgi:hypothetical protein
MPISFNGNGINIKKSKHLFDDRGFVSELERDLYTTIPGDTFNAALRACLSNEGVTLDLPF